MKKPFVLSSLTLLALCLTGCGGDSSSSSSGEMAASSSQEKSVLTPSEIYAEVNKSTVFILIEKLSGYASGTGFFIDDQGTFVTNYHVIEDGKAGSIADYQGNSYKIDYVKGYDENLDVAICASSATNTHAATLGNSDKVEVGETVYAIGYPEAFTLGASSSTFTSGMVSMHRSIGGYSYIQATVDITNGNSGGPLINEYGEVIGITTAGLKYNEIDYMNLSVPINRISLVSRDGRDSIALVTKKHQDMPVKLYVEGELKATLQVPYGKTASFPTYSKEGYTFDGWYTDSACNQRFDLSSPITDPVSLYGKWKTAKNKLSVVSNNEDAGRASVTKGKGYSEETVTVYATPINGSTFKGWYDGGNLVSEANPYTFTMPASDYSLTAVFWTKNQMLGIEPGLDLENNIVAYGLYPQKHVSDCTTIALLDAMTSAESNEWYLLNNVYYAKKEADPSESTYVFDDGTTIVSGTTYWFKCEPITWKVFSSDNGEYSLVSTVLLDAHRYNESYSGTDDNGCYANNYANSEIREWLNGDFYDSAFSLGNSLIQTTAVDNSASTTDSSSNSYACANTEDKVYLLSYKDYLNADYGFPSSTGYSAAGEMRGCKTTDWARANGAFYCYDTASWLYEGNYWTRSPCSSRSNYVWSVLRGGRLCEDSRVEFSFYSVRPAVTVKITQ